MAFTSKQDWFSLFSQGAQARFPNAHLKKNSALLFALVIAFHIVIILLILSSQSASRSNAAYEKPLQLLQLQPEKEINSYNVNVQPLSVRAPEIQFVIPESINDANQIQFIESDLKVLPSADTYELPSENAHLYPDVFDPRLRKKLQENHQVVSKAKLAKLRTWKDVTGNTVVEVGEGSCIRSMPSTGNSRAANWSLLRFKCGRDEGEKMMDNVTADLEARKHPLHIK